MEEKVTIRLIRNATLRIHYAGKEILVDPMLAGKGTLQSALGVYKTPRVHLTMPMNEIVDGLDMVLLTHNHIDHYDPTVKQHLAKNILFLTQPHDKESITQDGFTNVESIEKDKTIGDLTIHRIQGHHGFGQIGEMMGPVSGYVLTASGFPTVYIGRFRKSYLFDSQFGILFVTLQRTPERPVTGRFGGKTKKIST